MFRLLTILLFITTICNSQVINASMYYVPKYNTLPIPLLDIYPSATYAYSLRKLSSNYSGYCVNVRRSNDNSAINVGFVNNYVDTTTIKSFCTTNVGYVTQWYDQSGNGYDAIQGSATAQPIIYNNGFTYKNGRIQISFSVSTNKWLTSYYSSLSIYSIFSTAYLTGSNATATICNSGSSSNARDVIFYLSSSPSQKVQVQRSNGSSFPTATQTATVTNLSVLGGILSSTKYLTAYVNNSAGSAVSANITGAGYELNIGGSRVSGSVPQYPLNGGMSELVIYASDQTANITGINSNINNSFNPKIY